MKNIGIIIMIIIIVLSMIVFGVRFFSGEDNWTCQNGVWVKHGNPSTPQPDLICK